uniref:Uncharacterized protein n=1 Tax=Calcidiscus leptoporus TaxID=127549 RepID=A0A7S0J8N5_9EUKA
MLDLGHSAVGEEDEPFGDFGGFSGRDSAQPPALAGAARAGHGLEDEAAADDDFGDFGSFSCGPPGGAGDTVPTMGVTVGASAAALSNLAADEDDSFSKFAVPTLPGSSAPTAAEAPEGLSGVLAQLLASGRFEEAESCKAHIECLADLAVHKSAYDAAKMNDNLEEAIRLRDVVLPRLREQVQPDEVVLRWQHTYDAVGVAQMTGHVQQLFGEEQAAPFLANCPTDLVALAARDLPAAAAAQRRLRAAYELLLELSVEKQKEMLVTQRRLLEAVVTQMRVALAAIEAAPPTLDAAARASAMASPQVLALMRALQASRKLALTLAAASVWLSSICVLSANLAAPSAADASPSAAEADTLLGQALALTGADESALEPFDPAPMLTAPIPLSERCALTLMPLVSGRAEQLPPVVEWKGHFFHAPSINFWIHNVSPELPSACA